MIATPPHRSIRRSLLLIVLVAVLPMGLFAGGLLYSFWQTQQSLRNQEQTARVRTIAALIESELDTSVKLLQVLASDPLLEARSLADFHARSRRLLEGHGAWANLALVSPDGQAISAATPLDTRSPNIDSTFVREAFATKRPVISDIYRSKLRGVPSVAVAVPVLRQGEVPYVLVVALKPDYLSQALRRVVPTEGVAGVFDRELRFVARAREPGAWLGKQPGEKLMNAMRSGREGVIRSVTREGEPTFTSWTSLNNGWSVGVATPSAPLDSSLASYLTVLSGLWLVMLVVGLLLARLLWTRIDRNLSATVDVARQLAAGKPVRFPRTSFVEVASLSHAITDLFDRESRARADAIAASAAKDEFLAMLGHELRNPLAPIRTAVYLMRLRAGETLSKELGIVERQLKHMVRLVDDLLDVARIARGGITLSRKPVEVSSVVSMAIETVSPLLEQKRIRLSTRVPVDGAFIHGDPDRLCQILANLLTNAIKFTAQDGRVDIGVAVAGDTIRIDVEDDGIGMRPDALSSMFDLFTQGRQNVERPQGGLGLGLSIARSLARLHGGDLTASSEGPGRGSTFSLVLPTAGASKAIASDPDGAPSGAPSTAGRPVLIVDDNTDAASTLSDLLGTWGYSTQVAHDGPSALRLLQKCRFDVALLDIGLPVMDGYQLAQQIRGDSRWKEIRLIALTGYGQETDRIKAKQSGFDDHLVKPVDPSLLAEVLR